MFSEGKILGDNARQDPPKLDIIRQDLPKLDIIRQDPPRNSHIRHCAIMDI